MKILSLSLPQIRHNDYITDLFLLQININHFPIDTKQEQRNEKEKLNFPSFLNFIIWYTITQINFFTRSHRYVFVVRINKILIRLKKNFAPEIREQRDKLEQETRTQKKDPYVHLSHLSLEVWPQIPPRLFPSNLFNPFDPLSSPSSLANCSWFPRNCSANAAPFPSIRNGLPR